MTALFVACALAAATFVYYFLVGLATGGTFRGAPLGAHIYSLLFAAAFLWLGAAILGIW